MPRTSSLQSRIITYIQDFIKINGLKAGDRLPSQGAIAALLGVSVIYVREAVKTLEAKNILNVINGKGVFVREFMDDVMRAQIEISNERESLLELIHIRKILEKEALSLFIKNATPDEINELGKITSALMTKYRGGQNQTAEDQLFHSFIYKNCHNRVISTLIMSISDMLVKFQEYPLHMDDPFTETIPLHEELYLAIRERKIKKAQTINNGILNRIIEDIQNA